MGGFQPHSLAAWPNVGVHFLSRMPSGTVEEKVLFGNTSLHPSTLNCASDLAIRRKYAHLGPPATAICNGGSDGQGRQEARWTTFDRPGREPEVTQRETWAAEGVWAETYESPLPVKKGLFALSKVPPDRQNHRCGRDRGRLGVLNTWRRWRRNRYGRTGGPNKTDRGEPE